MARTRKAKPKSPEQIAAEKMAKRVQDFQLVGLSASAASLPANNDVQVDRATRQSAGERGNVDRASRLDVFALLYDRKGLTIEQYRAVRRLEERQAVAMGAERPAKLGEFVQTGHATDLVTAAMIDASNEVKDILKSCGGINARLLQDLTAHQAAVLTRWRVTVQRVTGETRPDCQSAAIRSACANLAEAWIQFDYRKREKAA